MKAALLVLVPSLAFADVDVSGELATGAGGDTTATYAVASGSLAAELSRAPVPLLQRGLVMPPENAGDTGLWFFTGVDDDDRDHVRAEVSALAHATTYIGTTRAEVRGAGWQLSGGVAVQPVGSLRDGFWRSGRGITATTIGFEAPPAFALGDVHERLSFGGFSFEHTDRGAQGSDGIATVRFIHYATTNSTGDVFALHDTEYELYQSPTAGLSAQALGLDVVAFAWKLRPTLELRAHGGFDALRPMAPFTQIDNMVTDTGPSKNVPRAAVELARHTGEQTLALGGGSWSRLDPSGNAADAGGLATGSFDDRVWRLRVHGGVEVGRLRRVLLGPLASADLAPVGTRAWMGRGELATSLVLAHGLAVAGEAWVERSDRDDPRWSVPATGALATHAGADVTASWRFRRL